jgi:protein-tyrosine-phosphatase
MNVLFVCSGNISRSFLAEVLLRNEIRERNLKDISVSSAGLFATPGDAPDPKMLDYLTEKGILVGDFAAKQITKQDVEWADLILVMERGHEKIIEEMWPEVKPRLERLGKYTALDLNVDDIVDPFGKSTYHYRLTQAQITLAVKTLIGRLGERDGVAPS